eukprot:TRINITY_DN46610_c0_g1_i1.p1 TRINITY_DN46610_c0_g1~~TRINITY_DN46610_c0_g1_i1.p1  ORF type:complete len:251 (+),score=59.15 TRINITY_DN46610_c0_g1_i1:52-753(+)
MFGEDEGEDTFFFGAQRRSEHFGACSLDDLLLDLDVSSSAPCLAQTTSPLAMRYQATADAETVREFLLDGLLGADLPHAGAGWGSCRDRCARRGCSSDVRTPSPSADRRGPVVDDYDIIEATAAFAARRTGDASALRAQDLQASAQLCRRQAARLAVLASPRRRTGGAGAAGAPAVDACVAACAGVCEEVAQHYGRIAAELNAQALRLEAEGASAAAGASMQVERLDEGLCLP